MSAQPNESKTPRTEPAKKSFSYYEHRAEKEVEYRAELNAANEKVKELDGRLEAANGHAGLLRQRVQ